MWQKNKKSVSIWISPVGRLALSPVLSMSQPNRKSTWFIYGRHVFITFFMNIYELRHWQKHIHSLPSQTPCLQMKRMETSFSWSTTKKPGLVEVQALSSQEHCLNMPLSSRSQNVPSSKKLNMVETKLKPCVFRGSPSTINCTSQFGRNIPNHLFLKA